MEAFSLESMLNHYSSSEEAMLLQAVFGTVEKGVLEVASVGAFPSSF